MLAVVQSEKQKMLLEIILSRHKNRVTTELVLKSDLIKRPAALKVSHQDFPLAPLQLRPVRPIHPSSRDHPGIKARKKIKRTKGVKDRRDIRERFSWV